MHATTLSVADAIAEFKRAGFDARFQHGRVWFDAAGKLYSVTTDYRAEVSRVDIETIIKAAGGKIAASDPNARFVEALKRPDYAYARFRHGCVWAYRHAPESPTGVLMVCGTDDVEFAEKAMREIVNNSPLSPTEGLKASGARLY